MRGTISSRSRKSSMADGTFDIEAAKRNYRARILKQREERHDLWAKAREEADRAIEIIVDEYSPMRVIQWGSILRADLFTEVSDIDIAIEGIDDMETWSRLERRLLDIVSFPLDLVRFDRLHPEHRKQILMRGRVVYERE